MLKVQKVQIDLALYSALVVFLDRLDPSILSKAEQIAYDAIWKGLKAADVGNIENDDFINQLLAHDDFINQLEKIGATEQ